MVDISRGIVTETSNGGELHILNDTEDLRELGTEQGYGFYDDLYVDPEVPMTLDISDDYDIRGTLQRVTGDAVMSFDLTSREPNGRADIRFENLAGETYYRLQFDGVLAQTARGRAHGQTTKSGVLTFHGVNVPNE